MKKILFIALFAPLSLMAQKASFGVKAGINFSNTSPASEIMRGYSGGGFVAYTLSKVVSLNGELLFTKYAYDVKNNVTNAVGAKLNNFTHFSFSKIEIPVTVKAMAKTGVVKPFASFGISTGFNISGNFKQDAFDIYPERTGKLNNMNHFNMSLAPSVGFEIKDHIIFDARYNVGLTKQFNNSDIKVNTFYLTLGYKF